MGSYLAAPVVRKEVEDGVGPGGLRHAAASMQGWRMSQEDSHIALPKFDEARGLGLFAVFDGHCGGAVSRLVAQVLPKMIRQTKSFKKGDYPTALSEAFLAMDKYLDSPTGRKAVSELAEVIRADLIKGFDIEGQLQEGLNFQEVLEDLCSSTPDSMGCTATVALIEYGDASESIPAQLHVANAGDSRAVLWDDKGRAHAMSKDHKPRNKTERSRVEAAGGWVTSEGRIEGNLNLSRALADFEYKRTRKRGRPEDQMISGVPEVRTRLLKPSDQFLLLGCDGVWETRRGSQATVDVARRALPRTRRGKLSPALARLLNETVAKDQITGLGMDNMTAVMVELTASSPSTDTKAKMSKGVTSVALARAKANAGAVKRKILKRPAAVR